jgi:cysteine desulfurase
VTIYLDYAATTPVDTRVAALITDWLTSPEKQGNPASSTHGAGLLAARAVEFSRQTIASLIGAAPREIIFTSGATEANNLAILGIAGAARRRAGTATERGETAHFVSARTEHKSVLDVLLELERRGAAVTWIEPDEWGRVPPDAVRTALRADTLLVSIMHANNELGCINDIAGIAAVCRERGVPLHTDASQSVGKIDVDVTRLGADFVSFTAHKIYGPKGVGALYVRESARPGIAPIVFGGGHERGLRSGTLATHQIAGFARAAAIAREEHASEAIRIGGLRLRLMSGLGEMPGVTLNTLPGAESLPGIVNASFEGVEGESLVTGLTEIAVSTGSACSSATREPSYVLRALGRDTELAQSSLRISIGRFTTDSDIEVALNAIRREVSRLRLLAGGVAIPGASDTPAVMDAEILGSPMRNPIAWRYFHAPPRLPRFPKGSPPTGISQGRAGRRPEGTEVCFEFEIAEGFVKSARFSAYGCPHTLAVAAWLCEVLEGAPIETGLPGTPADWAARFEVPTEKLGRLLIVEDALRAALYV